MKINSDMKKEIITLIQNGDNIEEIAKKFDVSRHSISRIKYLEVLDYQDRIKCSICGLEFKQITNKHLKQNHNIDLEKYKIMFPQEKTYTEHRSEKYKTFKHPNKGKTYEEIYGVEDAKHKREIISKKNTGRKCPELAGTGISGTRKDTGTYARSTYEANIDRIFIFENKKYADEFTPPNKRFELKDGENTITYQPDRVDLDGLFCKDSFIEVKGYMHPEDWQKICLFREKHLDVKLIVISDDIRFSDILYSELEKKYKPLINLWEDEYKNYKNRPDLYNIDYQPDEITKYLNENFKNQIHISIQDKHKIFMAEKCVNYNKVSKGKKEYVVAVNLINISNKRSGSSRKSSGVYNYELWEIKTLSNKTFYVTNTSKTILFYCYEEAKFDKIKLFFEGNSDKNLNYGKKQFYHL